MSKLGTLFGSAIVVAVIGVSSAWAGQNTLFVDPENGTDNSNTTCTQFGAGASSGPCATLNQALANANAGATIYIEKSGGFGPIYLTSAIAIVGPANGSVQITWSNTMPGCVGGAAGSCNGSANANYAVEIAANATADTIKFKNILFSNGNGTHGAMHVASAFGVSMTDTVLRGGGGTIPEMMLVDSSQGSQLQILMKGGDVEFSSSGGGIALTPSGSTPVKATFNNTAFHNATFGIQAISSSLTGGANIQVLLDSALFTSFNNSAVSVLAPSGSDSANVAIARSSITNTGGAAIKSNGAGSFVTLYENVITGNSAGINLVNGGGASTFQNNQIFGNGVNCEVASVSSPCSSALNQQSQN